MTDIKKVRTRFAPSPTGYLHIGGLRTALYGYLFAKKSGGEFILRLEDTDTARFVAGSVDLIYNTLKDSGLIYSEGPDVGGKFGPYIQSERKQLYIDYAEKLVELGGAYYCFCDKDRIASLADDKGNHRYDKHCLKLSKEQIQENIKRGIPYVIRQNVPEEGLSCYKDLVYGEIKVDYKDIEDGILLKSDKMPTYNFANVIDDYLMGITHVIRGTEYLSSTPKYNLLYDSFGWERPIYIHLPPIMKNQHEKLSKRNGDASYQDFVDKGYIKEAIINYIALLGWSPKDNREKFTLQELVDLFSLEGISKSPSIFDETKMKWLSGEYIKEMSDEKFLDLSKPFFEKSKIAGSRYDLTKIAPLLKTRVEILSEIPEKINFLEEFGEYDVNLFTHKKMKTDIALAKDILPKIKETLINVENFTHDNIHNALICLAAQNQLKNGQVLWSTRVALSGKETTPCGATELADILGKTKSIERLDFSISLLSKF